MCNCGCPVLVCRWCVGHCSYGEMLLLIAIHLREKQLSQIEELVSDTLQMKVTVSYVDSSIRIILIMYTTHMCASAYAETRHVHVCKYVWYTHVHCTYILMNICTCTCTCTYSTQVIDPMNSCRFHRKEVTFKP